MPEEDMQNPIMVINFSVNPDAEPEFNQFYHGTFIPRLVKFSPEILNVRRYEESGVGGSLRWYNKQFLTIYQLKDEESLAQTDAIFERAAVVDTVKEFRQWKDKALRNFSRINFDCTWIHGRQPQDGAFAARPFFLWQLEMKPDLDADFQKWYENDYLPLQVAEIPSWVGAVRYASVGRDPIRHLTFFETADEANLSRALMDLRAPHRIEQNYQWQQRVDPAVTWHDATCFRPIYRWPD
jgi:hypothetical protein